MLNQKYQFELMMYFYAFFYFYKIIFLALSILKAQKQWLTQYNEHSSTKLLSWNTIFHEK